MRAMITNQATRYPSVPRPRAEQAQLLTGPKAKRASSPAPGPAPQSEPPTPERQLLKRSPECTASIPPHRATSPAEPDPEQPAVLSLLSTLFLSLSLSVCVSLSLSGSNLRLGSRLRQLVIVCARVRGFAASVHVAAEKHPRKRGHGLQAWVPDLIQEPHTSRRGDVEPCSHAGPSCTSAV